MEVVPVIGSGTSFKQYVTVADVMVPTEVIPFSNNVTVAVSEQPDGVETITETSALLINEIE